ncbi:unnamed protein product [Phytophthora fragariaefolia]|uniref:Unnamed protein product n=1 Tax=Phytophthora fragariaefolia TaxID=1490495 RepID=A0A9W6TKR8_9STRA|nr:unnamed protein product [Phytophthora fragariaefolia]
MDAISARLNAPKAASAARSSAQLGRNLPMDSNMSTGRPNAAATHVAREDCLHLVDPQWEALQRLVTVIGEAAVAAMLRTLSPTDQHGVALGFIGKEQRKVAARATVSTPSTPRVESLKLHENSYVGREGEPLLRWLVEVDTAITARRIVDPLSKVAFAMSCLGGRARSWAYGRRLTDPTCLSTSEVFKEELRQAFEPPQNEFRSRAEFIDLQLGLSNAPATFNRLVTQLFRPLRAFAQTYFDDIFVHSRGGSGQTVMEMHLGHLRRMFEAMRANKLYMNIDKCVFGAEETNVLGCFGSSAGVRADPEKVKAIGASPTPRSQKNGWAWPTIFTSILRGTQVVQNPCWPFSRRTLTGMGTPAPGDV